MQRQSENWLARAGWLGGVVGLVLSASWVFAQEPPDETVQIEVEAAGEEQPGEYWIGVGCSAADEALRAQLGLPENQGLVVFDVVDDSPAAKAGIQRHDVLVAVGDKPLGDGRELVEAVHEAQENEITLKLLRTGKEQTISLKPEKRAHGDVVRGLPEGFPGAAENYRQAMEKWFEGIKRGERPGRPLAMRFFRPGMVLPPGTRLDAALPQDMSVTITKRGKEPAKISVRQGDKVWEVTDDKLADLPPEVRGHVERMLGHMPLAFGVTAPWMPLRGAAIIGPEAVPPHPPGQPGVFQPYVPGPDGQLDQRLEKRFDDLEERLERLQEAVEKLEDESAPGR